MSASVVEQLRLLRDWAPLIGYGRRYAAATDPNERALVCGDLAEWLASKTPSTVDDRIVRHVVAILKTPEGEALVRDLVAIIDSIPPEDHS